MLQGVLDLFKMYFGFVLDFYNETFMIDNNISAWDFIIVCFVAGGIITLLVRSFGGSGMAGSAASTKRAVEKYERRKKGGK